MDWLRQLPIGQYVAEQQGGSSWLWRLDSRLKLLWTLAFLLSPILAGSSWRLLLVLLLLCITLGSGMPSGLWRRGLPLLLGLCLLLGGAGGHPAGAGAAGGAAAAAPPGVAAAAGAGG